MTIPSVIRLRRWLESGAIVRDPAGGRYDAAMFAAAMALLALGTMLVFSTTTNPHSVPEAGTDPFLFLKRHVAFAIAGMAAFAGALVLSDRVIEVMSRMLYPISIVLLILVFVPGIGFSQLGAHRWINLGLFTLQPSEIAKLGFAMWLAFYLSRNRAVIRSLRHGLLPIVARFGILGFLLVMQPDIGSTAFLFLLAVAMVYAGGTRYLWLALGAVALVGGIALVAYISPEKLARFVGWLMPEATRLGEGYQVFNSMIAVGSGGLYGSGLGEGMHHILGHLPMSNNDFIVSVAAEELGFVGIAGISILYVVIAIRGIDIARRCRDQFSRFMVFVLTLLLVLPSLIHMAVDLAMLPPKGLVCPFLSYGGTSLVVNLGILGLIQRFHVDVTSRDHGQEDTIEGQRGIG